MSTEARSGVVRNREGLSDFYRPWTWSPPHTPGGFTAVIRAKNEERNIPYTLPPILRAVDSVILVDNGSDDHTASVAIETAAHLGLESRLTVLSYPFDVSRCGVEHRETPADSLHSLTHYYNWAFAHVATPYAVKWDADMLITDDGIEIFAELSWRVEASEAVIRALHIPVYMESATRAYVDTESSGEPFGWPNSSRYYFGKAMEWELLRKPPHVPIVELPEGICFELKWLSQDEFDHWSSQGDFQATNRTARKKREWHIFNSLRDGVLPTGMIRVEAEDDEKVVDRIQRISRLEWQELRDAASPG